MERISQQINAETIDVFIPIEIKKRVGTSLIICPKNSPAVDKKSYFDNKLIKMIGKAHKWKILIESGRCKSLADIARIEKVGTSYVSKVFNLNFLSPKIIKAILNGNQPRTLKLQDIISNRKLPDLWQEQEEVLGF